MPAASAMPDLSADSKLVALARVLEGPIDTSPDADRSQVGHLGPSDRDYVEGGGIDLIVPAAAPDGSLPALVVLGPKRSEEPFSREDRDLLVAIAGNVALVAGLTDRSRTSAHVATPALAECPQCGGCFDGQVVTCPQDSRALAARSLPRTLAGRYRLDRRLATGGMGTVYESWDTALDRPVAAKVIREDIARAEGVVDRFVAEARIAARLVHPNVVTVYDFGVVEGRQPFLVMERLRGKTLRQALEESESLPIVMAIAILAGISAAVDAAHHMRLVHRDLKPENIFLVQGRSGLTPKVLDFGVAKALLTSPDAATHSETQPGVLLGTPEYMAPEQLRGEAASTASDIWSLAVMARELLVSSGGGDVGSPKGRLGWSGSNPWDPGGVFRPAWPRTAALFDRALALDPALRPTDPSTFITELEHALHGDRAHASETGAARHAAMHSVWL